MKQFVLIIFLLATTCAMAQSDLTNDYLLTISGNARFDGDLSESCGSRIDMWVVYQDGQTLKIMADPHGGDDHFFTRELKCSSTNKIISIVTYGRAYPQSGCSISGQGNADIQLDTTSVYPCHNKTYFGKFIGYSPRATIVVNLRPLSSVSTQLNVTAQWYNNANEDVPKPECPEYTWPTYVVPEKMSYETHLSVTAKDGTTTALHDDALSFVMPGQTVTAQGSKWFANINEIASLRLTTFAWIGIGTLGGPEITLPCFSLTYATTDNPIAFNTQDPWPVTTLPFSVHAPTQPGFVKIEPKPYVIPLKYVGSDNILPYDPANRVAILGPRGNAPAFYHWMYSTDGTTWTDLPSQFQGKQRVELSGYELMGENFYNYHHKSIFFKIFVDCNGGSSSILTLSGRISVPNIVSVTPMMDRCYDQPNTGAFTIVFNRPLLNENGNAETLMISVRDLTGQNAPDQIQNIVLDANNSFTWPRRLPSDRSYEISLIGSYLGSFTYSDDPVNHYKTVTLTRPQPVSSTITPTAVNCYGGGDGQFTVQALGGAGNYALAYVHAGMTDSVKIDLGSQSLYTVDFLEQATYTVRVKDGNGCVDKAGAKNIVITQPSAPVTLSYSNIFNPRGYGYTDGYVETIVTGGTPPADKSYTVEWFDQGGTRLPDALYNNKPLSQGYQAELDSVGDGYYTLKAYDSHYGTAHPDHRAGCMVETTAFRVIQPTALVVTLSEYHFVSCNGYTDGRVLAQASGGVRMTDDLPYTYTWFRIEGNVEIPLQQFDSIAGQLKAGVYRVSIIDQNNVPKRSAPFTLVQPDVLQAQVLTTPVSCSSGADGTATTPVTGGTAPFSYLWSYNDNTSESITHLIDGVYFVLVHDTRGCMTTASGRVGTPALLQVDSVLANPICTGYADGSIGITVTQGTAPYRYEWNTGDGTQTIDGLAAGTYTVSIIDNNSCRTVRSYTLEDPEAVRVSLGADRYLCNDQTYVVDASIASGSSYAWNGSNGFTANTPAITVAQAGTYTVEVTTTQGCKSSDAVTVRQVDADIVSEFIVSTQAFAGDDVTLLNISDPQPDSVQWGVEDGATMHMTEKQQQRAVMVFPDEGAYTVFMKAYRQGCEAIASKTVTVLAKAFQNPDEAYTPFIVNFAVSPNPVHDNFQVMIGLQEAISIRLRMISMMSNAVVNDRQETGNSQYVLPYSTGNLAPGTYILLLETAKGNALLKLIVY